MHARRFDWNPIKAKQNLGVHNVSFAEAQEAFLDENAVDFYDPDHSTRRERRYNLIGHSSRRLLFVVYTEPKDGTIWLISARKAEAKYRKRYEEENA